MLESGSETFHARSRRRLCGCSVLVIVVVPIVAVVIVIATAFTEALRARIHLGVSPSPMFVTFSPIYVPENRTEDVLRLSGLHVVDSESECPGGHPMGFRISSIPT
jgi:hypothetical protein